MELIGSNHITNQLCNRTKDRIIRNERPQIGTGAQIDGGKAKLFPEKSLA